MTDRIGLFRRNRGFGRLMAAQAPADFADWLSFVALASLLAYHWQAPPLAFALLGLAMGLPAVVIGPLAGVLVDRWRPAPVLFWSNLGRGAAVLSYILAPDWPSLIALVALAATVDSFFTPAKQAALQALVGPDDRAAANGLSQSINQISKIAGPALGGALLALTGPAPVFALTAAASALAALLTIGLPLPRRSPGESAEEGLFAGLTAGLRLVAGSLHLRAAIGLMAAGFFGIFLYDTLIAPLLRDFGLGPELLGLCLAANGAGGVLGALAATRFSRRGSPFAWVAGAMALGGVIVGAMATAGLAGLTPPAGLIAAAFGALGLIGAFSIVPLRTAIQAAAPPAAMGRIAALTEAAATAALLVAPLIGAALASFGGTALPFAVGAGVALITAGIAALTAQRLA